MRSFLLLLTLFPPGGAMAIEEPAFTVVRKTADYEIRSYGRVLVAETEVDAAFEEAGNQAFRILADYIFGKNRSKTRLGTGAPPATQEPLPSPSEKIAMTAPVGMEKSNAGFRVQFTLPASLTLATAPEPIDARVKIRELPPRTLAVYRYSGSWSEERYQRKLSEFQTILAREGIPTLGAPHFARFNSPFALWFLRRNEIWIPIK